MKSFFSAVATVAAVLFFSLPSAAQIQSATLKASGLTCSMCSKAIYKALQKVSTVQKVNANIETSEYTVIFKPGAAVVLDAVKKAVEDAGFSVASMKVQARVQPGGALGADAHTAIGGSTFHFINAAGKPVSGDITFSVVDKAYVPLAVHKAYGQFTTMRCYETGYMESCCAGGKPGGAPKRVYHAVL